METSNRGDKGFVRWLSKGSEAPPSQPPAGFFEELQSSVGGKATNLAKLSSGGFSVPPAFAISVDAHRRFLNHRREKKTVVSEGSALWPAELEKEIREAYDELSRLNARQRQQQQQPEMLVAVRSSGLDEDSAEHAFAGMHDTFLNVKSDELLTAIERCWASVELSDQSPNFFLSLCVVFSSFYPSCDYPPKVFESAVLQRTSQSNRVERR